MNPDPTPPGSRPSTPWAKRLLACLGLILLPQIGPAANFSPSAKFELAYATYLGGTGDEMIRSLTLGSNGEIYRVGSTSSPDFPVSPGAVQPRYGGNGDAFIVKLTPKNRLSTRLREGQIEVGLLGEEGRYYWLHRSFDLEQWRPWTNVAGLGTMLWLPDPEAISSHARFYLAVGDFP